MREWLSANLGASHQRYAFRFVALAIVGVGYLLHRREQRNADLLGLSRPNGWKAGVLCGLIGWAVLVGFIALVDGV